MPKKRSITILATFLLSLLAAIALLILWVVWAVRSSSSFDQLAGSVGGDRFPWIILTVGCVLLTLVIVGISYQLAQALAARRYSAKQDELISNITHELRSPLAAIKLHAQTLEQPAVDAATVRDSTAFILERVDKMVHLVDDVLESSRLVARKAALELEPVAVGRFFTAYFAAAARPFDERGMRLVSHVDSAARVLANEPALARVMDNLLDNARRFSDRGGEVRCRVEDGDRQVTIEVADDGIGLPKKELTKIFDRFYQVRGSGARRGGTGLGLSIVSGLVAEMGGSVHAFSHEGRPGTRFVVELPQIGGER